MAKLTLLSGVLLLLFFPAFVSTTSHWESYEVPALVYDWTCYAYTYTVCDDWLNYGYYRGYCGCTCELFKPYETACYTEIGWNCYTNCAQWEWIVLWRCEYGWTGCNCDIPICDNPTCTADQICIAPNQCDCVRSSTGQCEMEPCNDGTTNCYPGTCNKTGSYTCVCIPGFTGRNCQTITHRPEISNCFVQLFGTPNNQVEQQVALANECAAVGLPPPTVWVGAAAATALTKIVATWQAQYVNPINVPTANVAPFILNAPVNIGITESNFTVSFPNQTAPSQSVTCVSFSDLTDQNIGKIQECNDQTKNWNDLGVQSLMATNFTILISVEAQLGGAKVGNTQFSGGRFDPAGSQQIFSQDSAINSTIQQVKFTFDLDYPYQCLSLSSKNCPVFPIFLNQSMTSNPVIQPTFDDWHDAGSGVDRYHAQIYYLQPSATGQLAPVGDALIDTDVNVTLNNFRYTCSTPGVYAIVLTVFDKANNSATARKIFNYDNDPRSVVETSVPVHLDAADPMTDYQFIKTLVKPQNNAPYQFNLVWAGHFNTSYRPEWLLPVEQLPYDATGRTIDDIYGTKYGLRSVDAVPITTGVIGYEIASMVDKTNGGFGAQPPSTFTAIQDSTANSYPISVDPSLADGDAIVVWLRAYDIYGSPTLIKTVTYVDTSKFNIVVKKQTFQKHFPDNYNSSVLLNVVNNVSGIKAISFTITDNTNKLTVVANQTQYTQVLSRPSQLSNSRKKRQQGSVEKACLPTDPTCYCVPMGECYNVTQSINIDNCWIDRVSGDDLVISYTVYSLSGWGLDANIDAGVLSQSDIPCRGPILTTGAIIGISIASVIGFILLVLVIILLILLLVCKRNPIPKVIRTAVTNHFYPTTSTSNIVSENELYTSKSDVEYAKNTNETKKWGSKVVEATPLRKGSSFDDSLIPEKDLHIGNVISEGRFAVIRKGQLILGNEKTPVAVKSLRSGYDKGDPDVMRSKISFMANEVKPHPNLIKFMGAIAELNNEAPVMILELCDKPLKDWLSEISEIDAEVLENMLNFTLNIGRGVQHLHDQNIIHRRLAVRNVLLKNGLSGLEAKLIGFGPFRDDSTEADKSKDEVAVVPLKWMAPETLDTLNLKRPTYDEKTDAWSYGVTIWEIYSKGAAPYAEHRSSDIRAILKKGERLTCPDDCPPELFSSAVYPCWDSSAKKRPNMSKICCLVEKFRNGCAPSAGYYTAPRGKARAFSSASPPGYYSAKDALQKTNRDVFQKNRASGIYSDATSG